MRREAHISVAIDPVPAKKTEPPERPLVHLLFYLALLVVDRLYAVLILIHSHGSQQTVQSRRRARVPGLVCPSTC